MPGWRVAFGANRCSGGTSSDNTSHVKYFQIVMVPPPILSDPEPEPRRPRWRSGAGKQFRRDVAEDLQRFHPFLGRMPRHREELAEEIAARLTVLAVRTHV